MCTDFPETPIVGEGVPDNAPTLFGDPTQYSAGALCVQEPQLSTDKAPGAMIPANWVRPRFKFAGQGLNLFEIRIHSPAQKHDLVAYTKKTTWYLPKEIWAGMPGYGGAPPRGDRRGQQRRRNTIYGDVRGINSASPGMPRHQRRFRGRPGGRYGEHGLLDGQLGPGDTRVEQLLGFAVGDEGVGETLNLSGLKWDGQIGENGAVLRGYYDTMKLPEIHRWSGALHRLPHLDPRRDVGDLHR